MQIVRTIIWILVTVFVAVFVLINYGEPQRVKIWPSADPVGFDWPVGIIALVFWLLGVLPFWLYHRGVKWSLDRRIRSLESSIKSNALSRRPDPALNADQAVGKPEDRPADNAGTSGGLSPADGGS
ncbi:MAG: LapA family protein [Pseudomonadota bacterium]